MREHAKSLMINRDYESCDIKQSAIKAHFKYVCNLSYKVAEGTSMQQFNLNSRFPLLLPFWYPSNGIWRPGRPLERRRKREESESSDDAISGTLVAGARSKTPARERTIGPNGLSSRKTPMEKSLNMCLICIRLS